MIRRSGYGRESRKTVGYTENNDWADALFVRNPSLFLPELESCESRAGTDVDGICKILKNYHISPGSKILDFSCGIGRHALRLARKNYNVVGYDPSEFYIRIAETRASREPTQDRSNLRFYSGKVEEVGRILRGKGENQFDAIIIMFNSIGYNNREDDSLMLRNLSKLVSPDAIIIIEAENRDWRLKNFLPFINYSYPGLRVFESWTFNPETSVARSISRFFKEELENESLRWILTLPTHMRLYSLHELMNLLNEANWSNRESLGNISTMVPCDLESPNIVTVSRRRQR